MKLRHQAATPRCTSCLHVAKIVLRLMGCLPGGGYPIHSQYRGIPPQIAHSSEANEKMALAGQAASLLLAACLQPSAAAAAEISVSVSEVQFDFYKKKLIVLCCCSHARAPMVGMRAGVSGE